MRIDKRYLLKRVWLFADFDDAELDLILPLTREQPCSAGSILVNQGDDSGDMYALLSGCAKAVATVDGAEVLLSIMGPGEVFGEIALLDGGARSATVTALESCRLLVLSREAFRALLSTVPSLAVRLLEALAGRIRALTDRAESSSTRDVPARLARDISGLGDKFGGKAGPGRVRVTVNLSQQDLANLVGASREIVNRWLGRFARRGLVRHEKGMLTILSPDKLRALADMPRGATMFVRAVRSAGGRKQRKTKAARRSQARRPAGTGRPAAR